MGTVEQHRKGFGSCFGDLDSSTAPYSALLTTFFLAATLFLTSCGGGAASSTETRSSASIAVSIAPSSVNLAPGATQTFAATVMGSSNTAVAWSVQEGASGGSITAAGMYTAPNSPGTYHVVATSQADNTKRATATVIVPSFSITITPAAVGLRPGATQAFVATVTGSSNTAVMWSIQEGTAGGVITDAGVYTAPTALGTYHVIATSVADPTKSAIATVTVQTSGFFAKGSMATPRQFHTATLLANGKVLIAGGNTGVTRTDSTPTTSAELYDPINGTFGATGSMATPRYFHTATRLNDGKVLIAGGIKEDTNLDLVETETAEVYDPATGLFTPTGSMSTTRSGHTATLLKNGKVLIVGGDGGASSTLFSVVLASAELYDPNTGSFTSTGALGTARYYHTATLLEPSGKVLIVGGGSGAPGVDFATTELYDPNTGSFTSTGALGTARVYHTATLLEPSGKVLIAGGFSGANLVASAEIYDPEANSFTSTGDMGSRRALHIATALPNGMVLVAGGIGGGLGQPGADLTAAELFDFSTGFFRPAGNMMSAHTVGATATLLSSGKVLIVGGGSEIFPFLPFATAELYE